MSTTKRELEMQTQMLLTNYYFSFAVSERYIYIETKEAKTKKKKGTSK